MALGFGGERQRLGLLGVSGGGRGGRRQGGGGRGRGVQHAAVRGRRAVDHLLLRESGKYTYGTHVTKLRCERNR
ncbi:Uncharacterized protein DAT39_020197 [Clarias magur]|uniref:Uncharacterized protein n=1 Tax=Clarias magur TaxID=1594786 RepID=A0A8J4X9Y1_CLAMG|nr:Uncharacterized protein DAT39_020197 [Clarias magur]